MKGFKKEKIKYNISKASSRKKLIELLDIAKEGGYISEDWFCTAVEEKENDLGCSVLDEYLEIEQKKLNSKPMTIEQISAQEEIEIKKRVSKHMEKLDDRNIYPELFKRLRDIERKERRG